MCRSWGTQALGSSLKTVCAQDPPSPYKTFCSVTSGVSLLLVPQWGRKGACSTLPITVRHQEAPEKGAALGLLGWRCPLAQQGSVTALRGKALHGEGSNAFTDTPKLARPSNSAALGTLHFLNYKMVFLWIELWRIKSATSGPGQIVISVLQNNHFSCCVYFNPV